MHKGGFEFLLIGSLLALAIGTGAPAVAHEEKRESAASERLALDKAGVIEVFVGGPSDKPIANASVDVFTVRRDQRFRGVTDASGLTTIRIPPGEYQVTGVFKDGYGCPIIPEVIAIEDGQTRRVKCRLNPMKTSGIVRDETGNPLAGVRLMVLPIGEEEAVSDAAGRFEVNWGFATGPVPMPSPVLVAREVKRNLVRIADLGERSADLDLRLEPGVILAGTVGDREGKPLAGARVRVVLLVGPFNPFLSRGVEAVTGADGTFEVKAVPPNRHYTVTAVADGYACREVSVDTSDPKEGRCQVDPFQLGRANLSITGIIVDSNDKPAAHVGIFVLAHDPADMLVTETDDGGRFTLNGVSEDPVEMRVYGEGVAVRVEAEGGASDVKIVLSRDRSSDLQYIPRKPASLKGKPLPSLADAGIDLPAGAEGKMMLACLWDIGQRPSRNYVTQLAARATQLGEKGVVVVAVQVGQAEGDVLSRWIEENKVPFQIGRIPGDVDKTRRAWGVVSLPHLVLTDRQHIVVAEGFSLADLDKEIEMAAGR